MANKPPFNGEILITEACEILDSKRKPVTKSKRIPGPYPYYGANGVQDWVDSYIFDEPLILIAEDCGNFGIRNKVAYKVTGKCWVNNHAHVLRPREGFDIDFLIIALNNYNYTSLVNGTTRKKLNLASLKKITIPNIPIFSQREISSKYILLDTLFNNLKTEGEQLDQLIKSRFVEMFGTLNENKSHFPISTLQDECEKILDGTHQTPTYTDDTNNGIKFLSSKNVTTQMIDWENIKYIPMKLHEKLCERVSPKLGDVLLAKNGTTGIAAIVDREEIFDIYVSLALLRPKRLNSTYLWAAVNSPDLKRQFNASLKGIGVPNLHLTEIRKAKLLVPPVSLQQEFADFVSQVNKSQFVVQQQIEKLQTLYDSLAQEYFS